MNHLKLMTAITLGLALPALADNRGKGGRGNDRQVMKRAQRPGGYGVVVAPRRMRPVYPVYGPAPVYVAPGPGAYYGSSTYVPPPQGYGGSNDPNEIWNEDPRGSNYPDDASDDPYAYSGDPNGDGYADYAPYAPPPPQREVYGTAPGPGYVWVNGFWRWGGVRFAWSPGQWMRPPRARAAWTAGSWLQVNGRFGFRRGYWR